MKCSNTCICKTCNGRGEREARLEQTVRRMFTFFGQARVHTCEGIPRFYSYNTEKGPTYWLAEVLDDFPELKQKIEMIETCEPQS